MSKPRPGMMFKNGGFAMETKMANVLMHFDDLACETIIDAKQRRQTYNGDVRTELVLNLSESSRFVIGFHDHGCEVLFINEGLKRYSNWKTFSDRIAEQPNQQFFFFNGKEIRPIQKENAAKAATAILESFPDEYINESEKRCQVGGVLRDRYYSEWFKARLKEKNIYPKLTKNHIDVMVFAYRYAIGRKTYAPGLVCNFIAEQIPKMTVQQAEDVKNEVIRSIKQFEYVDDIALDNANKLLGRLEKAIAQKGNDVS